MEKLDPDGYRQPSGGFVKAVQTAPGNGAIHAADEDEA
jgi:hypothetical protein